jgi:hypothetical protein
VRLDFRCILGACGGGEAFLFSIRQRHNRIGCGVVLWGGAAAHDAKNSKIAGQRVGIKSLHPGSERCSHRRLTNQSSLSVRGLGTKTCGVTVIFASRAVCGFGAPCLKPQNRKDLGTGLEATK